MALLGQSMPRYWIAPTLQARRRYAGSMLSMVCAGTPDSTELLTPLPRVDSLAATKEAAGHGLANPEPASHFTSPRLTDMD